jgi:predicted nucleic acid-binding protein
MPGKLLLDTNVIIALLRGDAEVEKRIARIDEALVPWIALGELFYGALRSHKPIENRTQIVPTREAMENPPRKVRPSARPQSGQLRATP